MEINHKVYNYEIGNSIKSELSAFNVYNLDEQNKAIKNYRNIFDKHRNEHDLKSVFFVKKYYNKYNEECKHSYCDYLHPVNKILHVYLSGIWATQKYLKRICKKWNLNISDFKMNKLANDEIVYEFIEQGFNKF